MGWPGSKGASWKPFLPRPGKRSKNPQQGLSSPSAPASRCIQPHGPADPILEMLGSHPGPAQLPTPLVAMPTTASPSFYAPSEHLRHRQGLTGPSPAPLGRALCPPLPLLSVFLHPFPCRLPALLHPKAQRRLPALPITHHSCGPPATPAAPKVLPPRARPPRRPPPPRPPSTFQLLSLPPSPCCCGHQPLRTREGKGLGTALP